MLTVLEIIRKTTDFLQAKAVPTPRLDAELLVAHALRLKRMQLYLQFERPLTEAELAVIRPLVKRRSLREPLQYVLGETEFFHLRLKTDRRALVPRPETEELVDLLSTTFVPPPADVLDLGTGTGAIALALAQAWSGARVTAVDASPDALALAAENAAATGLGGRVEFVRSDWFTALPGDARWDLIVSNPPYLTDAEFAEAEPEVREHEPRRALTAASDGLADLEQIVRGAWTRLRPGGWLALETGVAQHPALTALAAEAGYAAESRRDLRGRDRFMILRRTAEGEDSSGRRPAAV